MSSSKNARAKKRRCGSNVSTATPTIKKVATASQPKNKDVASSSSGNSWAKRTLIKKVIDTTVLLTAAVLCVVGMCANITEAQREFSSADGSVHWRAAHADLNEALEAGVVGIIATYNAGPKAETDGNPIGLVHVAEHLWASTFFCVIGGFTGFAAIRTTGHILVSGSWTPSDVLAISTAGMICNRMITHTGDPSDTLLSTFLRIATILPPDLAPTSPADMLSKAQLALSIWSIVDCVSVDTVGNPAHVTMMKNSLRKLLAVPFFAIMNRFLGVNVIWILEGLEGKVAFKEAVKSAGSTSIAQHEGFSAFRAIMVKLHPRWNDGVRKQSDETFLRNVLSEGAVVTAGGTLVFWSFSGCNITGIQYRTFSERCYCEAMLARWWRGQQGLPTCALVPISATAYNDLYVGGGKDLPLPRELREQKSRRMKGVMKDAFVAKTGPFAPAAVEKCRAATRAANNPVTKTGMFAPAAVEKCRAATRAANNPVTKTGMFAPAAVEKCRAATRAANNPVTKTGRFAPAVVEKNRAANNPVTKTGLFAPAAVEKRRAANTGVKRGPNKLSNKLSKKQLASREFSELCDARDKELGMDKFRGF